MKTLGHSTILSTFNCAMLLKGFPELLYLSFRDAHCCTQEISPESDDPSLHNCQKSISIRRLSIVHNYQLEVAKILR
jgi:hypothetical protein